MAEPIAYVDFEDLKVALDIPEADTSRDDDLTDIALTASRQIDDYCDRYFGQVGGSGVGDEDDPVARSFAAGGTLLLIDDLVSLDSVEYESGSSWVAYDDSLLRLLDENAASYAPARPYTKVALRSGLVLPERLRLTGVWGWPAVPAQITRATRLQCFRLVKSPDVATGVVGGADNMGVLRLSASLHPDAKALCDPFVKVSIGG